MLFLLILAGAVALIGFLPTISIDAGAVIAGTAYSYIRAAMYFLPLNTVITILSLVVSLAVFRIVVSLVKTLWDMLPVGG